MNAPLELAGVLERTRLTAQQQQRLDKHGYVVIDEAFLTPFDHRLREFIDQDPVIPMRLINREGYVAGSPLRGDSLQEAYVDLDDMLTSSDLGMQMMMVHFLTERSRVRNYERRYGPLAGN